MCECVAVCGGFEESGVGRVWRWSRPCLPHRRPRGLEGQASLVVQAQLWGWAGCWLYLTDTARLGLLECSCLAHGLFSACLSPGPAGSRPGSPAPEWPLPVTGLGCLGFSPLDLSVACAALKSTHSWRSCDWSPAGAQQCLGSWHWWAMSRVSAPGRGALLQM